MELKRLTFEDADTAQFIRINDEAFPKNERVRVADMFAEQAGLDKHILGIYDDDGSFVGFFMLILTEDCAYVSYFAIDPALRCRGLGGRALKRMQEYCGTRQVVLDFEAPDESCPDNDMRLRRRAFYLRNGFYETGFYQYYMDCEFEIVSNRPEYDRAAYERLLDGIRRHFGNYVTPHYRKDEKTVN